MAPKHSYLEQVAEYRQELEWRRRLLAARVPRSLVVKAGTLAALGGTGALGQLLAACTGARSSQLDQAAQLSPEGSFKWSRYPMIEKYNYRNLPWRDTPYYDGLYASGHGGGPNSWDFVRTAQHGYGCIFDTLVAKKYGPDVNIDKLGPNQELWSGVAESWSHGPDYSYWDFKIRPNIFFHDIPPVNGRLFGPEDVQYTLDADRKLHPSRQSLAPIDRIETFGQTVRIHVKRPSLGLPLLLANPQLVMIAREHFEGPQERFQRQPIGTGPFRMTFQNVGAELKSVRNERYHERYVNGDPRYPAGGYKRPFLRGEESVAVTGTTTSIAAIRSGQLDYSSVSDFVALEDIIATNPEAFIQVCGADGTWTLRHYNVQDPVLKDVRVRRALSMALDRRTMTDTVHGALGQGNYRIQWGQLGLTDPPTVEEMAAFSPWLRYDPARAKALLAEAGYANGFELQYLISAAPSSIDVIIQQQLAQIGVRLTYNQKESVVATQLRTKKDFGQMTAPLTYTGFEPSGPARAFWLPDSPHNIGNIDDPLAADLAERITYTLDPDEQVRLLNELNARDVDQQYHLLLPHNMYTYIWQPWVYNVANAPSGLWGSGGNSHHQLGNAWIDDTAPRGRAGRKA